MNGLMPKTVQEILLNLPVAVLIVNQERQIVFLNQEAERTFNYQKEELLGSTYDILLAPELRQAHAKYCNDYFKQPKKRHLSEGKMFFAYRSDGGTFPVDIGLAAVNINGKRFVCVIVNDITYQRDLETKLTQSRQQLIVQNKLKQEFLSVLEVTSLTLNFNEALNKLLPHLSNLFEAKACLAFIWSETKISGNQPIIMV